ncbi:unnamed protein product [Cercopithifilaria johnstoni]|uniref:Peptidase A1 domain-containing protein n=1 Tax=Cercopithifilaria johnstoni TaxID=2874296 RepID=A0A8J2M172_9BILA|nr:unnamed protein product [Cercopithifilaria johnstoni]
MRDKLIISVVILCCLQATLIFAEHQVELHPIYNKLNQHTGYAAKVMIGEPKKEFSLLLDTVTAFLLVFPSFHPVAILGGMQTYSGLESRSFNITNIVSLTQIYGSRIFTVCEHGDNISFDLLHGTHVDFTGSPVHEAGIMIWPKLEDYQKIDGVLGLSALHVNGFPYGVFYISSSNIFVMDNLIKKAIRNNELDPVITIALPPLDSNKTAILTLGGRDTQTCNLNYETTEPFHLSHFLLFRIPPDQSANRYEFKYNSIKMGNAVSSIASFAYPNTIEPYIGVPYEFLQKIVRNLNATFDLTRMKYVVKCDRSIPNTFEPFEISTDSNIYIVSPEHFIIKHNPNDTLCELAFGINESIIFDDPNAVMLGLPFFHQYCVMLEPRDRRINFAPII